MRTVVSFATENLAVRRMFASRPDFWVGEKHEFSDIIVFTGGADVHPSLYGQKMIQTTVPDKSRDKQDSAVYDRFVGKKKLVGICRGAQFLNVKNGGMLWQHVNNHSLDRDRTHPVIDLLSGKRVDCTSTHHQVMRPSEDGEILAIAKEATYWQDDKNTIDGRLRKQTLQPVFESEVVWYKNTNSLCFQPHPEYGDSTNLYFFKMLETVGII